MGPIISGFSSEVPLSEELFPEESKVPSEVLLSGEEALSAGEFSPLCSVFPDSEEPSESAGLSPIIYSKLKGTAPKAPENALFPPSLPKSQLTKSLASFAEDSSAFGLIAI